MKRASSLILFVLVIFSARAQSTRIYLDQYFDRVNDSAKASYKVILKRWPDDTSLWAASRYTMKNQVVVEGVYNDRQMTIPNGDFKYYYNQDTIHYLKESGGYFNGAKFGPWIEYYPNGKKITLSTYRDNVLNGPYEAYNQYDAEPVIKGQYIKGKKEGKWLYPAIIATYENDREIATEANTAFEKRMAEGQRKAEKEKKKENFKDAIEPYDFVDYMRAWLKLYTAKWPPSNAIRNIVITFTVGEDGKLTKGKIVGTAEKIDQDRIARAVDMAPPWKPATSNGKPLSERVTYTFIENKGEISKATY